MDWERWRTKKRDGRTETGGTETEEMEAGGTGTEQAGRKQTGGRLTGGGVGELRELTNCCFFVTILLFMVC